MQDEREIEILEKRALELARISQEDPRRETSIDAVAFVLGGREFALGLEYVREVRPFSGVTPLPAVPRFVMGIAAIRGEVISVVDVSELLGVTQPPLTADAGLIVLQDKGSAMTFALVVNGILGVVKIDPEELLTLSASYDYKESRIVQGVTASGMVFLDGRALLNEPSLKL